MDCFNNDKETRELLSDILAKCKHKMANNVCSLNDCSNCAFGYALQFAHKYMSEVELDFIKVMAQMKYESTDYDPEENEDDDEDEDEDSKDKNNKNSDENSSTTSAVILVVATAVITTIILACVFASW